MKKQLFLFVVVMSMAIPFDRCLSMEEASHGAGFLQDLEGVARFTMGLAWHQGDRPTQEDRHAVLVGEHGALFGVYDGHGGQEAAHYVKASLLPVLASNLLSAEDEGVSAFEESFKSVHKLFELSSKKPFVGTTAVVAALYNEMVTLAHVGDSRGVVVMHNGEVYSTRDHKPGLDHEQDRIAYYGGKVCVPERCLRWYNSYQADIAAGREVVRQVGISTMQEFFVAESRLCFPQENDGLAMSRSIGDVTYKKVGNIALPEVKQFAANQVDFIILATDGLWDAVSSEDAVAFCRRWLREHAMTEASVSGEKAKELACALMQHGLGESHRLFSGSAADNITVMVIMVQGDKDGVLESASGAGQSSEYELRHRGHVSVNVIPSDAVESDSDSEDDEEVSTTCDCCGCIAWLIDCYRRITI